MLFSQYPFSVEQQGRGGSSNLAASKVETFAIIVYFWKPLSIIAKGSILNMKEVPDPPVKCLSITLFTLFKRSLLKKLMRRVLKTAFAFYQFNEYVIVTLNVNNGGTNICCDCETFKVFLTSHQIGFGHSEQENIVSTVEDSMNQLIFFQFTVLAPLLRLLLSFKCIIGNHPSLHEEPCI